MNDIAPYIELLMRIRNAVLAAAATTPSQAQLATCLKSASVNVRALASIHDSLKFVAVPESGEECEFDIVCTAEGYSTALTEVDEALVKCRARIPFKSSGGEPSYICRNDLIEKCPEGYSNQELLDKNDASILAGRKDWTRETRFFQEIHNRFEAFLNQRKPGDELWMFSTGADDFAQLAGRAGYVIVRGETAVAVYLTLMS